MPRRKKKLPGKPLALAQAAAAALREAGVHPVSATGMGNVIIPAGEAVRLAAHLKATNYDDVLVPGLVEEDPQ